MSKRVQFRHPMPDQPWRPGDTPKPGAPEKDAAAEGVKILSRILGKIPPPEIPLTRHMDDEKEADPGKTEKTIVLTFPHPSHPDGTTYDDDDWHQP